jgi:hypothetical protein
VNICCYEGKVIAAQGAVHTGHNRAQIVIARSKYGFINGFGQYFGGQVNAASFFNSWEARKLITVKTGKAVFTKVAVYFKCFATFCE